MVNCHWQVGYSLFPVDQFRHHTLNIFPAIGLTSFLTVLGGIATTVDGFLERINIFINGNDF
jgi:hypothetical protein